MHAGEIKWAESKMNRDGRKRLGVCIMIQIYTRRRERTIG